MTLIRAIENVGEFRLVEFVPTVIMVFVFDAIQIVIATNNAGVKQKEDGVIIVSIDIMVITRTGYA